MRWDRCVHCGGIAAEHERPTVRAHMVDGTEQFIELDRPIDEVLLRRLVARTPVLSSSQMRRKSEIENPIPEPPGPAVKDTS